VCGDSSGDGLAGGLVDGGGHVDHDGWSGGRMVRVGRLMTVSG
jgi:hypothetical protein